MRIGFVELVLLLFIASITVGPNVALFADRWLRRAQRTSAAAARRKAQLEAQAAIEREALMTRFRVASNIFALLMLAALAYGLLLRPIDTPPKAYTAPDVRQDTGAAQTALSADSKDSWKLGGYLGVDCVRTQDGLVYAAAYNGAAMKKRQSDLVRTDGGHYAAILSVEGELTSFAFDADGDLWLTVVTPSGGALCRARHDSWGTSVEQVVTQIDGAPLGVLSAVETGPDGKVYFAAVGALTAFLPKRRGRIEQMDWTGKRLPAEPAAWYKNNADKMISIRCIRRKQMRFYASLNAGQAVFRGRPVLC